MTIIISGPGVGLPVAANLYPSQLFSAPYDLTGNTVSLAPGDQLVIPAGDWIVDPGLYGVVQFNDPQTGTWRLFSIAAFRPGNHMAVRSDGFSYRIANLMGCPVTAVVTAAGTGYAQATTTVTAGTGTSTWLPVIGGAVTTISVTSAGSGYGVAPLVFIGSSPPFSVTGVPALQATATAAITGGTVSSITMVNTGAGYPTIPTVTILPNPTDPNINSVVAATATAAIAASAGTLTAVVCTNPGVPLATAPTLTVAGAGASGTATAYLLQCVSSVSVTTAGGGYTVANVLTSIGGSPTAGSATNPIYDLTGFVPRPCIANFSLSGSGVSVASFTDRGMYLAAPTAMVLTGGLITTVATVVLTMGTVAATVVLQPK